MAASYVYDAENRLVSASSSGGTTLGYDPLGRSWQVSSPQTGITRFVYEGDHVAAEYDGAGAMRRRFFWGPEGIGRADEPNFYPNAKWLTLDNDSGKLKLDL